VACPTCSLDPRLRSGGYVRRLDQGSITSRDVMGSFKQFFSECLADRSPSARAMIANVPQSS